MAKTTDKSESPVIESSDLLVIDKAGQAANARKAVQTYQRACSIYGDILAKCGPEKDRRARINNKDRKLRRLTEADAAHLTKEQVKAFNDASRIKDAWLLLTGEFWATFPLAISGKGEPLQGSTEFCNGSPE